MTTNQVSILYHGSTFVELVQDKLTIFVDPVFSTSRRGRRLRGETKPCDYMLLSRVGDDIDDALDLLEDHNATLVASERTCAWVKGEIELKRDRVLDLEPWERASDDACRITALPNSEPSLFDDGMDVLGDLMGSAGDMPRALSALPGADMAMRGVRAVGGLPSRLFGAGLLNSGMLSGIQGKPSLGWRFEYTSGQNVVALGAGIHAGTDERDLEDIASLGKTHVLLIDVVAKTIDPVVRAVRAFEPASVLLYRSIDVYGASRRSQAQPISAFIDALHEDQGDDLEVLHIRSGDRYLLEAPAATPAAAAPAKPAASSTTTVPSPSKMK